MHDTWQDWLFVVDTFMHLCFPIFDKDSHTLVTDHKAIKDYYTHSAHYRVNCVAMLPALTTLAGYLAAPTTKVWLFQLPRLGRLFHISPIAKEMLDLTSRRKIVSINEPAFRMMIVIIYNIVLTFMLCGLDWLWELPIQGDTLGVFVAVMMCGTLLYALVVANMTATMLTAQVINHRFHEEMNKISEVR